MKKFLKIASVASVLAMATVAFADAPALNMLTITGADVVGGTYNVGSGPMTVNVVPTDVSVNGTVMHDPNLNPVNAVNLYVNGVFASTQVVPNGSGDTYMFALPWTIPGAADYTLKVTASHGACPNCMGSDEETLTVISLSGGGGGNPGVNCPAAPAIAGDYMRTVKGVKAGSAKWKKVINDVAWQTGSQGTFWAKYSCGGGPNNWGITYADQNAYASAVKTFVDGDL